MESMEYLGVEEVCWVVSWLDDSTTFQNGGSDSEGATSQQDKAILGVGALWAIRQFYYVNYMVPWPCSFLSLR